MYSTAWELTQAVQLAGRTHTLARSIINQVRWEQASPVPITHSRLRPSTVAARRRRQQLAVAVIVPLEFTAGISPFLLPHTTLEEQADLWVLNHSLLSQFVLRLEYCSRCLTNFICDRHWVPIPLIPMPGDWEPLRGWLTQVAYNVRFDGLSWVESILFMEKNIELHSEHLWNWNPTNPVNVHRALVRLIRTQRDQLRACFQTSPEQMSKADFSYATMDDLQTFFIQQLQFAKYCVAETLPVELAAASTDPVIRYYRDNFIPLLGKRQVTVSVAGMGWRLSARPGTLMQLLSNKGMAPHCHPDTASTK
jgi:hypothetical protein